ncbi:uncharacterized protein NPIL_258691 [Nephila pilipes]|uniref:Uncharacterized protein n=1 Tax=Nephila pilipes TaxID=299642 RepID=A0A8X6TQ73_NEPPI|nr:uncharacterized protein NPIL_258691 [Nephila pilipes]
MKNISYFDRVCECDSWCGIFGDCCADAGKFSSLQLSSYTCMSYGTTNIRQGAYMINSCPVNFVGDEIRRQCRNDNFSDPLFSTPVTDTLSRKTYLNRYCAFCNDASQTSLKTWLIYFCEVTHSNPNITWDDVTYSDDHNKWGYLRDGYFYPCEFAFDKPPSVDITVRPCRSGLISTCPRTWTRQNYIRACDSYLSAVSDSTSAAYRNPHCAVCNGVPVDDLTCLHSARSRLPGKAVRKMEKPLSFAILLDVNRRDGNYVGLTTYKLKKCGSGEIYDTYKNICRRLVCAFPGYKIEGTKCVKQ